MNHASHSLDVFDRVRSLNLNGHLARFGQDQMGFNTFKPRQDLEDANSINRPRGPGNTNDQFFVTQLPNSNVILSPFSPPTPLFNRSGQIFCIFSLGKSPTSGTNPPPFPFPRAPPSRWI